MRSVLWNDLGVLQKEFENDGDLQKGASALSNQLLSSFDSLPALLAVAHMEFALISLCRSSCPSHAATCLLWIPLNGPVRRGLAILTLKVSVALCSRKPCGSPRVHVSPNHGDQPGSAPCQPIWRRRCAPSRPTVAYQPVSSSGPSNLFTSIWVRMFLSKNGWSRWIKPLPLCKTI